MASLKKLLSDSVIYGLSSIVGRFLNYLLVPVYTYHISAASGGYGVVTNVYAYTALLFVILTFGMETTFFYYSNREGMDRRRVFSTALTAVGSVAALFVLGVMLFIAPISATMGYADHPEYIQVMAVVVALDAFQAILFDRLRLEGRPWKFFALKMGFILLTVALTLFIFLVAPHWSHLSWMGWYDEANNVKYIFYINLFCTAVVTFGFVKELKDFHFSLFSSQLLKHMLQYAWPLLLFGIVGIFNQVADKILLPKLLPGDEGNVQLGIYGACVKIAMLMALITQAFRFAYEPFVFGMGTRAKSSEHSKKEGLSSEHSKKEGLSSEHSKKEGLSSEHSKKEGLSSAHSKKEGLSSEHSKKEGLLSEPYKKEGQRDKQSKETQAQATKYFIMFTLLAFLAVMCYIDLFQHFVGPDYREALPAIPIVMMAEILMGIYFNLSFWYKLNGQTWWGAVMSTIGCVVLVAINILFVPKIGYMACAWGGLAGYGVCVLLSYFIGQKKNPVPYPIWTILGYFALALILFAATQLVHPAALWLRLAWNTVLLLVYVAVVLYNERALLQPILKKLKKA